MKVLALVTARGGSKGFPGKNLALLGGRPLVRRSLALLKAFRPDAEVRIHLSTDSAEIAAAWPEPFRPRRLRPAHLATDTATSLDVVLHELAAADAEGFAADAVLLVQPTSPLIAPEDLGAAWARFREGAESVLGMVPLDHPVQWTWTRDAEGRLRGCLPAPDGARRQDLGEALRPAGFYLVTRASLEREQAFLRDGLTVGTLVPRERGVDIDAPEDLDLAKALLARSRALRPLDLGGRLVGPGHPCFVIAEAGVNHNGSVERALEMVRAAAEAGADAVKFQTFKAEALVTAAAPKAAYQARNTGKDDGQLAMLKALELPEGAWAELQAEAVRCGIRFLSTPFDEASAALLDRLGVEAFKAGSGELTNLPFLKTLARTGRPLILSSGMATLEELMDALDAVREAGDPPTAMLHCLSAYPAPPEQYNLRAVAAIQAEAGVPAGLSDHSLGTELAVAAVALGACILEKHFTLDRSLPGPDHAASLLPPELGEMVRQVRLVESALGDGVKRPMPAELDTRAVARRSLVAARPLAAGTVLAASDLACKRPSAGLPPGAMDLVAGRRLRRDLAPDEPLAWSDLED